MLGTVLYGVSATDPVSFMRGLGLVLAAIVIATLVPAWRAARTNPLTALRHECPKADRPFRNLVPTRESAAHKILASLRALWRRPSYRCCLVVVTGEPGPFSNALNTNLNVPCV